MKQKAMSTQAENRNKQVIFKTYKAQWGTVFFLLGIFFFIIGALLGTFQVFIITDESYKAFVHYVVWYSALPTVVGILLICIDIFSIVNIKRAHKKIKFRKLNNKYLTVALTAYNDELSIDESVRDFLSHPYVKRVLVISNNSTDATIPKALGAGAIVYNESKQGYGSCVHRALSEAVKFDDTDLVVLCEGDMTFRASDIDKFLAYISHADVVNGTRIVEKLQDKHTQVTNFIHYGNFAVAKFLEMKYLGDVTLSDVGTTYKVIWTDILKQLLPQLNSDINLEFNAYFIDITVESGHSFLEVPITFYPRVGISKGASHSFKSGFIIGLRMLKGILFGWKK